jgi:hypothetical protein
MMARAENNFIESKQKNRENNRSLARIFNEKY